MTPSFWTIIIIYINIVHPQKHIIRNKSHILCDGSIANDSCIDDTIICPEGFDCEIICNVANIDIQIPTEHHYCPSPTYGCCRSHIYCPFGRNCNILCNGGGCTHTHIHATNASYLQINGCNKLHITSSPYTSCHDMYIYCPINGTCQFNDVEEEEWNLNKDMTAYFDTQNKSQMMSYVTVGILLLIPILIIIIALIYHHSLTGSDSPSYFSVFCSFINTVSFYTDVLFCVFLFSDASSLYIFAMIFTALPHIVSIVICIVCIHKWRDNIYKIAYIKRYDNLVIGLTVLTGFVPTIQLLSSKLFYALRLTLHIILKEKIRIQQLRFINNNILEDIPLIILQIITRDTPITLIAFCFSFLSLIIGAVSFVMECGGNDDDVMTYELQIKSNRMESRHYYCHRLLSECLCLSLNTNNGIETVSVIPIMNGISCRIEIKYVNINEIEDIDALFKEMTDDKSNIFNDFKATLCNLLHIVECTDLTISISKLDLDGYTVTKLKRRNTVYIPLKRSTIKIEEHDEEREEDIPLKQESLLFETMKGARINKMEIIQMTEKKHIDDICEIVYLESNDTQTTTQSASRIESKENHYRGNNVDDKTSKSYESELLSQFEW